MYLYGVTLQQPQGITHAIYGNFSAANKHELVVARSARVLELIRVEENYKCQVVISTDSFGVIRSIQPFRLPGASIDYIIVGSDSGKITILQYDVDKHEFKKVHMETFGKTGCRRIVPGQFVAVDPKGRATMIAAVEKQKLVYVLNRDDKAQLTIASPLECHRSRSLIFDIVGVDVGYENPIFAVLEVDYEDDEDDMVKDEDEDEDDEPEKMLTFYELDLGLNHVVRRWSDPVGFNANMMLAVPGDDDGPGGVLICAENLVLYKNQGCEDKLALLPRRKDMPDDQALLIVTGAIVRKKGNAATGDNFFFLLQSELGDIYEAKMEVFDGEVRDIHVNYFDTLPVCSSICIMKAGFLFAASEFGNHSLYQITQPADSAALSEGIEVIQLETGTKLVKFQPRPLKRLSLIDKMESSSPILDMRVADLAGDDTQQIYTMCGRGPNSSLRVMRHGLPVSEIAASLLPSVPNGVWTVRKDASATVDTYIVVSFAQATIVLSVGGTAVQEVTDSGFVSTVQTLSVSLLGDDAMLQVHPDGIRHIRSNGRKQDWKPPGKSQVVKAAVNQRQVIVALSGGLMFYFELDDTGQLLEVDKKEMGQDITSVDIAPISEGRARSRFLTVGTADSTVRILSLASDNCLTILAVQKLPDLPTSLCMVYLDDGQSGEAEGNEGQQTLYLNIGLNNGLFLRTVMDPTNGSLSDTRTRYLGARPAKLFRISLRGQPAIMALSTRPWLCYAFQKRFHMTPLSYQVVEFCSSFASAQCPDGVVSIAQNTLRIFTVERLGESFNQTIVPLKYTPKRSVVHPDHKTLVLLESDHRTYTDAQRKRMAVAQAEVKAEEMEVDEAAAPKEPAKVEAGGEDDEEDEDEESHVHPLPAPAGTWASGLRVIDPTRISDDEDVDPTLQMMELDDNEAGVSMCVSKFSSRGDETFLCVGTALEFHMMPRSCKEGRLRIYSFAEGGKKLELVHMTSIDDVPTALCEFQGRLLVGVGSALRIYDIGKRKMLRKCENKNFPHLITQLKVEGNRVVVGDVAESFIYVRYRTDTNSLHIFADDTCPRWLTASCQLDYDTTAGADKFGNFFVVTLPTEISEVVEDDPTGARINWFNHGVLNGAPNKLETVINYYTGDIITSMHKAVLVAGGDEAIVCSTLGGSIVAFLPITSRSEVDFLSALEMHLRQEMPPLCGRDHLAFRSYYFPVKSVVDGDLCEMFSKLPLAKQRSIAEELDGRTPGEVAKKLEDMRNHVL